MKRRTILVLPLALAAVMAITGCSTQADEPNKELSALRAARIAQFMKDAEAALPSQSDLCASAAFAEGWYDSKFTHQEYGQESLMASFSYGDIRKHDVDSEIARRNRALVRALNYAVEYHKPLPSCRIDVFYQIDVIKKAREVGDVRISHELGVGIAHIGREGQRYVEDISSKDRAKREAAQRDLAYYADLFELTDMELRWLLVPEREIKAFRERQSER